MTNATDDTPQTDWSQLAKEALDLWQNHLTSLATDPQAKEEMARFVAPMSEMAANWSTMMQQGFQGMMNYASAAQQAAAEAYGQKNEETQTAAAPEAEKDEPVRSESAEASSETLCPEAETPAQASDEAALADNAAPPLEIPTPVEAKSPSEYDEPISASSAQSDATVEPVLGTVVGSVPSQPAATRGRAAPSDGSRSLAELAGRLAALERELDQLRPKTRRKESEPAVDESDRRVAGADKGANSA